MEKRSFEKSRPRSFSERSAWSVLLLFLEEKKLHFAVKILVNHFNIIRAIFLLQKIRHDPALHA